MEYQQIAAAGFSPAPSTDTRPFAGGGPGTVPGRVTGGLVFGTLLGPEATGPRHAALCGGFPYGGVPVRGLCGVGLVFLVSWLHRAHTNACVGCVVRGCCLRTT